ALWWGQESAPGTDVVWPSDWPRIYLGPASRLSAAWRGASMEVLIGLHSTLVAGLWRSLPAGLPRSTHPDIRRLRGGVESKAPCLPKHPFGWGPVRELFPPLHLASAACAHG